MLWGMESEVETRVGGWPALYKEKGQKVHDSMNICCGSNHVCFLLNLMVYFKKLSTLPIHSQIERVTYI